MISMNFLLLVFMVQSAFLASLITPYGKRPITSRSLLTFDDVDREASSITNDPPTKARVIFMIATKESEKEKAMLAAQKDHEIENVKYESRAREEYLKSKISALTCR